MLNDTSKSFINKHNCTILWWEIKKLKMAYSCDAFTLETSKRQERYGAVAVGLSYTHKIAREGRG